MGVWYSFICGLIFQLLMEIYFIFKKIDWYDAAKEAAKLAALEELENKGLDEI
jgi:hypothetical protein